MFDVSCLGILTADVLVKPVENLPLKGQLKLVDQLQLFLGGCAANAAIDLAKLGASVQIFGKLGNDSFGDYVKDEILSAGVNIDGLLQCSDAQTSASIVNISQDGERTVLHCPGSNAEFCWEDIDFSLIRRSKILFVAGTFLMEKFDGYGACKLLKRAQEEGILCCLDTAWDPSGEWMKKIESNLPFLDWFMPSYEEAVQLSGRSEPEEIVKVFQSLGAKSVVIKLGSKGCYVRHKENDGIHVPTYEKVPVVDTAGAGDSFCAGFLVGLLQGWEIRKCAQFANAVGSHCVMSLGTTTGIKPMKDILSFMEQKKEEK